MEASSFLISFQRSDWRVVRGWVFSPQDFSRFPFDAWHEFPATPLIGRMWVLRLALARSLRMTFFIAGFHAGFFAGLIFEVESRV
jgi:hypothetical protein